MAKEKVIELEEDLHFQKKWWHFERIAWMIMVLIVIAALFGLIGRGFLSHTIAGNRSDIIWIEFERFLRNKTISTIHVTINDSGNNNKIELTINREYAKSIRIEQVVPEPEAVEGSVDYILYRFKMPEEKNQHLITFYIKPEKFGNHTAVFKLKDNLSIDFTQFIYP